MTEIIIKFSTDNAAFVDDYDGEVKRILEKITSKVIIGEWGGIIYDSNGNIVGDWSIDV